MCVVLFTPNAATTISTHRTSTYLHSIKYTVFNFMRWKTLICSVHLPTPYFYSGSACTFVWIHIFDSCCKCALGCAYACVRASLWRHSLELPESNEPQHFKRFVFSITILRLWARVCLLFMLQLVYFYAAAQLLLKLG